MRPPLSVTIAELNAGKHRPKNEPATALKKLGILGAGFMGTGIATVTALAGIDAVLIDRNQLLASKGKAMCAGLLAKMQSKAQLTAHEEPLSRIAASADYADLAGCDLVIESVFEDRSVKADAIRKAQAVMDPKAILASNTSTFPIGSLARDFERPADFIGIHFFSPVEKMGLVEIVKSESTNDHALAVAFDYVRALGKTPVIVNDGYEFFANRCVNAYLREGHLMLLEGVPPDLIEASAQMAGMPVGPLALSDEIGIDLIYKIIQVIKADLGLARIDARQDKLLETMVMTLGRHGRKNCKGFYDYHEAAPKSLWQGLLDLQTAKSGAQVVCAGDLKPRLLAIQAIEAVRCLEQGIVKDPCEADAGSVLGFGFAPATGGILSYADAMGTAAFLALCERLCAAYGKRFAPPLLLKNLAERGESFYNGFG